MEEDFVCTLILPKERKCESIAMHGSWSLLDVMSMEGQFSPSEKSMSDMFRILSAGTANPEVFNDLAHPPQDALRPAFLVHDDIIVWTVVSNLDLVDLSDCASLEICSQHHITISGPTLVCGCDPQRFMAKGNFRSLFRSMATLEVCYIEDIAIKWGKEGNCSLMPFSPHGAYRDTAETMDKHWLFPHDTSGPTPSLNDILNKKG